MPKGEIVGMFTGRVCLSLMERTTTMLARFTDRVCMARITMKTQKSKLERLRRNNAELHVERKCVLRQEREHSQKRR
jgi:hypothetical protein